MCRFCLVAVGGMHRLTGMQWPTSEVGRLFCEVTGKKLFIAEGLAEWYCDACLNLLRYLSKSLRMFNESDKFWITFIQGDGIKRKDPQEESASFEFVPVDVFVDSGSISSLIGDEEEVTIEEIIEESQPQQSTNDSHECIVCHESFEST